MGRIMLRCTFCRPVDFLGMILDVALCDGYAGIENDHSLHMVVRDGTSPHALSFRFVASCGLARMFAKSIFFIHLRFARFLAPAAAASSSASQASSSSASTSSAASSTTMPGGFGYPAAPGLSVTQMTVPPGQALDLNSVGLRVFARDRISCVVFCQNQKSARPPVRLRFLCIFSTENLHSRDTRCCCVSL